MFLFWHMPSPRATSSLSTQSSSILTYGGVNLIDPLVPVYVFFSIIVPTPRGLNSNSGRPDPPPNFIPSHLVLPVGIIYVKCTDFMSQYLALPASLPDTVSSLPVPLGGSIPF